ncbi:MAG: hypothetical protein V4720_06220 [Pseudomonadota bacterium]
MPAWTTLSNALVAVGAKPFATTVQALRDNPSAMAEGAINAPKIVGEALNVLLTPVDTTANAYGGWTNLDRAEWIEINGVLTPGATGADVQARLSSDNGATWSAGTLLAGTAFNQSAVGDGTDFRTLINIKTGAFRHCQRTGGVATTWPHKHSSGTLALTGAPNALQLRGSSVSAVVRFDGKILVGVTP